MVLEWSDKSGRLQAGSKLRFDKEGGAVIRRERRRELLTSSRVMSECPKPSVFSSCIITFLPGLSEIDRQNP